MTTPYPFQSGATLTAAQMNSLSELPVRSITASSTAIAADRYSRVIANGSAITYTLPSGVFEAGQVVQFHNINSTAATIAAGAGVTLNAAAGTTVAQYQSATIYAAGTASFVMFESDVTQSAGALVLVKTQTIGSGVASVQVTDAFNSTYDNYFIWLDGGASSTGQDVNMILGATTTGYYAFAVYGFGNSNSVNGLGTNNGSNWPNAAAGGTNGISAFIYLSNPNLARRTLIRHITSGANGAGFGLFMAGYLDNATQYTAFTLTPNTGTFTGGTIRVYGYVNS